MTNRAKTNFFSSKWQAKDCSKTLFCSILLEDQKLNASPSAERLFTWDKMRQREMREIE